MCYLVVLLKIRETAQDTHSSPSGIPPTAMPRMHQVHIPPCGHGFWGLCTRHLRVAWPGGEEW